MTLESGSLVVQHHQLSDFRISVSKLCLPESFLSLMQLSKSIISSSFSDVFYTLDIFCVTEEQDNIKHGGI